MPDVSQAEIGRRMYHVHREKMVEKAVKLIREALGPDWRSLTEADISVLGHVLQCTWNTIDQKRWETIPFGTMKRDTVMRILSFGGGVAPGRNPSPEAVTEIRKILLTVK